VHALWIDFLNPTQSLALEFQRVCLGGAIL
jgi:hypothetical protein